MSVLPDVSQLVALAPRGPGRVHLHLPGYRPGRKLRSQDNAPLCGVFVHRDAQQAPLTQARLWPTVRATWAGSGDAGPRYWCGPCLGRLVELLDMQDSLIGDAVARINLAKANACNATLTPPENMGSVAGAGGEPNDRDGVGLTPPAHGT